MFSQLIPAGNKVRLARTANWKDFLTRFFSSSDYVFTTSGTAALVYTLSVMKKKKPERKNIFLPAYTCPDVLSAILYCELVPVLVDLEVSSTHVNYNELEKQVNSDTLAIIGIDLFGVSEDYRKLKEIADANDAFLIRDSAQRFAGDASSLQENVDAVVLTFGRGKPVTLLDGGIVLFNKSIQHRNNNQLNRLEFTSVFKFYIKALLYNTLIHRNVYWWIEHAPLLHIGKTEYHEFSGDIVNYSSSIKYLPQNITTYLEGSNEVQEYLIENIPLLDSKCIILPFNADELPSETRLNRLPILVLDQVLREKIYQRLRKKGLGISKMYPSALPEIQNVPELFVGCQCEQARRFAGQILTLPVHETVSMEDAKQMLANITEIISA